MFTHVTSFRLIIVCMIMVGSLFVFQYSAYSSAPDILVNTTSDVVDFSGSFQVADLPGPDGLVSLREAIIAANNTPGPQVIGFNIPTSDPGFDGTVFTIRPISDFSGLPPLADGGTKIDGATQTAFTGNTNPAGPEVVLNGNSVVCNGLVIGSPNNVVHSLVINGFAGCPSPFGSGITISGPQASANIVTGCFVGLDASGTAIIANGHGINTDSGAANNRIGGASSAERNVISGNLIRGVTLSSNNNFVSGNFIGTDVTGTVAIGNGEQDGVEVNGTSNLIERNIISGNRSGVMLLGTGNTVRENFLGTDVTGTIALANTSLGAQVHGDSNIIAGNLVSGNALDGIGFFSAHNNVAQANRIGTDVNGNLSLGNGRFGVHISSGPNGPVSNGNRVEDNVIAGNGSVGVAVFAGVRNSISRNRIFSNDDLGIRLNPGLTPNDPGDFDTGPNELMNFPVLEEAKATPGQLIVKGTIDTQNVRDVVIEFFANPVPTPGGDPSGYGEGAIFLGTARPNSQGRFTAALPRVPGGTIISATATDSVGNTSEFAMNIVASFP